MVPAHVEITGEVIITCVVLQATSHSVDALVSSHVSETLYRLYPFISGVCNSESRSQSLSLPSLFRGTGLSVISF